MIVNVPGSFISELGFDNEGLVKNLEPTIQYLINTTRVKKRGRGYTWEFFGSTYTLQHLINEIRDMAQYKVYRVDPDCRIMNRRILRFCNRMDIKINQERLKEKDQQSD